MAKRQDSDVRGIAKAQRALDGRYAFSRLVPPSAPEPELATDKRGVARWRGLITFWLAIGMAGLVCAALLEALGPPPPAPPHAVPQSTSALQARVSEPTSASAAPIATPDSQEQVTPVSPPLAGSRNAIGPSAPLPSQPAA